MNLRKNLDVDGDMVRFQTVLARSSSFLSFKNNWFILSLTTIVILLFDIFSKQLIRYHFQPTSGFISITPTSNTGSLFSLFSSSMYSNIIFIILTIILIALLFVFLSTTPQLFSRNSFLYSGLIVGGALGNGFDRVLFGAVFDWIDIAWWPVFNIADTAIVCGVILMCVVLIKKRTEW
ncbi:MAG: signal peptidase II [Nanobdellota archaeon]